jgi:hypothetical protein
MLKGRESTNIEDQRGMGGRTIALGGGGLGMLFVLILALICGLDPRQLLQNMPDQSVVREQR